MFSLHNQYNHPAMILKRFSFALALLFGAVAALPLFLDTGFLATRAAGDSPFLLFRLQQLFTGLQDGAFPVRWMPDAAFGLGYPFFNFYAPLPFYFAAIFRAIGLSYVVSLKVTALAGFLIAAGGMYAWMLTVSGKKAVAWVAAGVYSFAPYHMVNVYTRGDSLGEFWAMAWYPLILLALHRAAQNPTRQHVAAIAASYGALVMTHNISALIFSPFVALYALGCAAFVAQEKHRQRTFILAAGGVLGLALAMWFWLPALAEQDTVQLDDQTSGYFAYDNHFRDAENLVQSNPLFDYDAVEGNPFSLGLIQAVLIVGGVFVLGFQKRTWLHAFLLLSLAIAILMITPLSEAIWATIPLLDLAQFPWRFLGLVALFGAALSAQIAQRPAIGLLALPIVLAGLGNLDLRFIPLTDDDVTAQRMHWFESFTGNIGTTIGFEYLPVDVEPRPYSSDVLLGRDPHPKFLNGSGSGARRDNQAHQQTWQINIETENAQIALPLFYWPGWSAHLEGEAIETAALPGTGFVQLNLPQGEHELILELERTTPRWIGEITSLIAFIVVVGLWRPQPRPLFYGAALLVAVVPLLYMYDSLTVESSEPLTADFAQVPLFHRSAFDGDAPDALYPAQLQFFLHAPVYPRLMDEAITPGLYFPRLIDSGIDGRSDLYLEPAIFAPSNGEPDTAPLADFGELHLIDAEMWGTAENLTMTFWWAPQSDIALHYGMDLSLWDTAGNEWARLSTLAGGAGLYPTGFWRVGELIPDSYRVAMPDGLPPGDYILRLNLYNPLDLRPVHQFEVVNVQQDYRDCGDAVSDVQPFHDGLAIRDINMTDAITQGDRLAVEIGWQADEPDDVRLRWSLGGETWETPLAPGSDTNLWDCPMYVRARHALPTPRTLSPGTYSLAMTLIDDAGEALTEPYEFGTVSVVGVERVFEVPNGLRITDIRFGDALQLRGYDVISEANSIILDVAWGAMTDPAQDFQYFIHVYDANGVIVAQRDAMPREYTYPTSRWAENEVITEQFIFTDLPSGTYTVGIGWTLNGDRLAAVQDNTRLPDDTARLPEVIQLP